MSEAPKPPSLHHKFSDDDEHSAAQYGWVLGWTACAEAIYNTLRQTQADPKPESNPKPCKGFRYIGQHLSSCDNCGKPYWDHSHMQVLKTNISIKSVFTDEMWDYEPIRKAVKARVREAYLGAQ